MMTETQAVRLDVAEVATPVGPVVLAVRRARLCALEFADRPERFRPQLERRYGVCEFARGGGATDVAARIEAYVAGNVSAVDAIDVETDGTPFQELVWSALRDIPVGETLTYGELARRIGRPTAVRAVGAANGANPVAIVVPCHRVIASDGTLHGYGGGLDRKRWLLDHETRHALFETRRQRVACVVNAR